MKKFFISISFLFLIWPEKTAKSDALSLWPLEAFPVVFFHEKTWVTAWPSAPIFFRTSAQVDLTVPSPPERSGSALDKRMGHLWDAIREGNAALASDALLPRAAFLEIRATKDRGKSWENEILKPFEKNIDSLHRRLFSKKLDLGAQYMSFSAGLTPILIPSKRNKYLSPHWKLSGSRISIKDQNRTYAIHIAEMISWRGDWYITKLRASIALR